MDLNDIISTLLLLVGVVFIYLNINNRHYKISVIPIKNKNYFFTLPLIVMFLSKNSYILLMFLCLILQINELRNIKIFTVKKFLQTSKYFLISWPILTLFSLYSEINFADYNEQKIVSELKSTKIKEEMIRILLSTLLIAPVVEEIFFRKILYKCIKKHLGVFFGIIICSVIFSVIHFNLKSFPILFIMGIILSIIYERTNNIMMPILYHIIFNSLMIFLILKN